MTTTLLIFPHQLFREHPGLDEKPERIVLVEEPLFFGDPHYPAKFHKMKLAYHKATMARFDARLRQGRHETEIAPYEADTHMLDKLVARLV
ncbi:MAG: cryptochrome/photolyase family protein, partial [Pseudomonadota bacterium]